MTISELATVLAWHDALAAGDTDTLLTLSSEDIELADASGAGQGSAELIRWAGSVTTALTPGRIFIRDGVVVAEESAPAGAIAFRVVHDQVVSAFRHPNTTVALARTGLSEADLVP